MSNVN
jgi:3-oxoacyl-[acyl-carrier protein] reductase